mmetsp:Transcript_9114/g.33269  ORF Transcript_9114/g.33269 Transcript_9114/m.33269 type:complete len:394 (+) Transcript_9114:3642-4823(+)
MMQPFAADAFDNLRDRGRDLRAHHPLVAPVLLPVVSERESRARHLLRVLRVIRHRVSRRGSRSLRDRLRVADANVRRVHRAAGVAQQRRERDGRSARSGEPIVRRRERLRAERVCQRAERAQRLRHDLLVVRQETGGEDVHRRLHALAALAREKLREELHLHVQPVEPLLRGVGPRPGLVPGSDPVEKLARLLPDEDDALALLQTERPLNGPPEQVQWRLRLAPSLFKLERVIALTHRERPGGVDAHLHGVELAVHPGPGRGAELVVQLPVREVLAVVHEVAHAVVVRRRGFHARERHRVVHLGVVIFRARVGLGTRAAALARGRPRADQRRENPDDALVELREERRALVRVSGDEQGFRVVVEDDPERLQHGAEEVPVVQPRDGSVAVLERI